MTANRTNDELTTPEIKALRDGLDLLHAKVDDLNAERGTVGELCLVCGAHQWDAHQGIIHRQGCPIPLARIALTNFDKLRQEHDETNNH